MDNSETGIVYTKAQAKGRRLRMARALTGLSRQDLHEKTGIATSTVDTWESGRVELTEKGASRVCESFQKLGIFCSVEWLLVGEGMPPHLMSETERFMLGFNNVSPPQKYEVIGRKTFAMPPFLDPSVKKELSFFMNLHEKAIFCIVKDKFLNSQYGIGDCVAGIEENPENLIGKTVILQKSNGESILCRLINVKENTANVFLSVKKPFINVDFIKVARVLWHRMLKR